MKIFFAVAGLICLAAVFSASTAAAQETAKTPIETAEQQQLRDILLELKQLRAVIVRTNVNQLRFQTTFDQYKAQQARVDSHNREMESIKTQLGGFGPFRTNSEDQLKIAEERLLQTTDQRQRQNLERQIQSIKRSLENQEQREKRLKERQTALEVQIPFEQSKLDQLNMELERIKQDINALLDQ